MYNLEYKKISIKLIYIKFIQERIKRVKSEKII